MTWQRAHHIDGFDFCFGFYLRGFLRRNFARIAVAGLANLPQSGYVAAANHNSWWDGFIPYFVHHRQSARRPFGLMMSDAELRRFPFFRLGGAFSVDTSSVRAARASVAYAGELAASGAAVWIYPEGALQPPGTPLRFTSGFVHAARVGNVPVVPVAMRFVMLDKQRPEAFAAFGTPVGASMRSARDESQRSVQSLLDRIDADIAASAFERYDVILRGRRGADDTVGALTQRTGIAR